MKVFCSVILQKRMASCKEEAMASLKKETSSKARKSIVEASAGIEEVWIMLTAALNTRKGLELLEENCLPLAWARHVVTMRPHAYDLQRINHWS